MRTDKNIFINYNLSGIGKVMTSIPEIELNTYAKCNESTSNRA